MPSCALSGIVLSERVRKIVTHLSGEEHTWMNSSMLSIILVRICDLWYQVRGFSEAILIRSFLYYLEMPVNHFCLTNCPETSWLKYLQAFILLTGLWSRESVAWRPHVCRTQLTLKQRRGPGGSLPRWCSRQAAALSPAVKEGALVPRPQFPSWLA